MQNLNKNMNGKFMSSSINMQKIGFNKYLYKAQQKKTNQCLSSYRFWVRYEWLQLAIFYFLLHLTQIFVTSLIVQDYR
jgi:hypothetical protein